MKPILILPDRLKAKNNPDAAAIQNLAESGDMDAVFAIGMMFHQGLLLPQNCDEGVKLLTRAVVHNHPDAARNLAFIYLLGDGVACNIKKGRDFMEVAIKNGHSDLSPLLIRIDNYYRPLKYVSESFDEELFDEPSYQDDDRPFKFLPQTADRVKLVSFIALVIAMIFMVKYLARLDLIKFAVSAFFMFVAFFIFWNRPS